MKLYKLFIVIVFTSLLLMGGIFTLIKKDNLVSKVENRGLAQKPEVSKEKLVNGTIFNEFDNYFRDQFLGRSSWTKMGTKIDLFLNKKKYNDVVIGKEGYLLPFNLYYKHIYTTAIQNDVDIAAKQMKELNNYINDLGGTFIFAGVPTQAYFNRDKYADYFENGENFGKELEERYFKALATEEVNSINMNPIFKNSQEQLYYKTDHHYNFNGAYLTYNEIINKLLKLGVNIHKPLTKEELKLKDVDKPFYGSWNSKLNWLYPNEDKAIITTAEFPKYKKIVDGVEDNRLYYYNQADVDTSYSIYMNGNTAEIQITTERSELPKVLIFGDSFTNAIEPLLFTHFNETRILDLRYYKTMNLYEYINNYKPDVVIYVSSSDAYALQQGNNLYK